MRCKCLLAKVSEAGTVQYVCSVAKLQTVVYDILPSRRQVPESGVRSVQCSL